MWCIVLKGAYEAMPHVRRKTVQSFICLLRSKSYYLPLFQKEYMLYAKHHWIRPEAHLAQPSALTAANQMPRENLQAGPECNSSPLAYCESQQLASGNGGEMAMIASSHG